MKQSGILVQQRLEKGILGGPFEACFSVKEDNVDYNITIKQCGIRTITIKSESDVDINSLVSVFNKLDELIMLGEGEFIPIFKTSIIKDDVELESEELNALFANRVRMFSSADFTKGSVNSFLSFDKYVNSDSFAEWSKLLCELDIAHNIALYSLANIGMPRDCSCVFLMEVFEALSELLHEKEIPNFNRRKANRNESQLQLDLIAIIEKYGTDIFSKEILNSLQEFTHCLVNSRNRIFHIKLHQKKYHLDGSESVLYAIKLSYLYRVVILSLLNVDYDLYADKLKETTEKWNTWNGVLEEFLNKIIKP